MRRMRLLFAGVMIVLVPLVVFAAEKTSLQIARDEGTVFVSVGKTPRLTYRYAQTAYKPYVKTLCTPSGVNILRDSPHDHLHHHGLMFAIAADGVDFWAEFPRQKPGSQVHREISQATKTLPGRIDAALISGEVDWISADKEPVMSEGRTITTYCAKDIKPSLLSWQTELSPAKGKQSVKLTGSHYFGLGMRFVESMDKVGRFFDSSAAEGPIVRGKERLTSAKWMAYTAPVDGNPVTVAMFAHPKNPRHPAKMFTMLTPFAYISATFNLSTDPLTLKAGKPLVLRYGVAVWDGQVSAEEVEKMYQRWITLEQGTSS